MLAPIAVLNYFNEQWHSIRDHLSMGFKYTPGNFFNTTNNRVESINAKLKPIISRYSSLEEFVDKFFLILRVLRCERDHKAALCSQKVPTTFHSAADAYSAKYMRYLTPYAYRFVEKQLKLRKQVVIAMHMCNSEIYEVKMGVMSTHIFKNAVTLGINEIAMLPHFFARENLGLDLSDECICDQHWTMQYYESSVCF